MTELFLAILAVNAIIWWVALGMAMRKDRPRRQTGTFNLDLPNNWTCDNEDCPALGLVYSFCGGDPVCTQCGWTMLPVKASYWALEKRVEGLEATILHYADGETIAVRQGI
jgi:hypothetical protein